MKKCKACHAIKPLSEYRNWKKSPDGKGTQCKACRRQSDARDYRKPGRRAQIEAGRARCYERNLKIIHEHLESHPCQDCGETDKRVLEFDHVRGSKEGNVSELWRRGASVKRLTAEIAKCEIRCANCHRRRTIDQFGYFNFDSYQPS